MYRGADSDQEHLLLQQAEAAHSDPGPDPQQAKGPKHPALAPN